MKQVLIRAYKLEVPPQVAPKLDATLKVFSDACNYISQTVDPKLINKPRIQGFVDRQQREEFSLSANHDININAAVNILVAAVALGDEKQTWSQAQDCF